MKTLSYRSLMKKEFERTSFTTLEEEFKFIMIIIILKDGSIVEYNPDRCDMIKWKNEKAYTNDHGVTIEDLEGNLLPDDEEKWIKDIFISKGNDNIKNIYFMEM